MTTSPSEGAGISKLSEEHESDGSKGPPEHIWLQVGDVDPAEVSSLDYEEEDVSWCWMRGFDSDVEYVRQDIHDTAIRERDAAKAALREALADDRPRALPPDPPIERPRDIDALLARTCDVPVEDRVRLYGPALSAAASHWADALSDLNSARLTLAAERETLRQILEERHIYCLNCDEKLSLNCFRPGSEICEACEAEGVTQS